MNAWIVRLRDRSLPWVLILGIAASTIVLRRFDLADDSIAWAIEPGGALGFGGWWFLYVVRPLYIALALGWLWRLVLVTLWLAKLSRVGLALVPTHPDRVGGMKVVHMLPNAFLPLTLAASLGVAAAFAHRILSHGAHIKEFGFLALTFTLVWALLMLLPLLVLVPMMMKARREAIVAYGALVGEHGRLAHRRWIGGEDVGDPPLLSAPEFGPIADTGTMFQAVLAMQMVPIAKITLIIVLAPIVIPFLLVMSLEIPLPQLLQQVLKILM